MAIKAVISILSLFISEVDCSLVAESEEYTAVPEFPLGSGLLLVVSLSAYIALTKNPSLVTRSLGHLSNTKQILLRLR